MRGMRKLRSHVALAGGASVPFGLTMFRVAPSHHQAAFGSRPIRADFQKSFGAGLMSLDPFPSAGGIRCHVDPRGLAADWLRVGADMKTVMSKVDKLVNEFEAAREHLVQAQAAGEASGTVVDVSAGASEFHREMQGAVEKATQHAVSPEIAEAMATLERVVAKSNRETDLIYDHTREALGEALETLEVGERERQSC